MTGFVHRILRRLARKVVELAWGVPFEDAKRPRMVYDGWTNPDGSRPAGTRVSDTVHLYRRERIVLGDDVFVWHGTILDGTAGLVIEDGCQIGAHVGVFTHSSHVSIRVIPPSEDAESHPEAFIAKPVRIGRRTFVASGATILAGTTIGKGCLIGAGSVVAKDVPDFSVVAGNPGRVAGDTRKLDAFALHWIKDERIRDWHRSWQENP